MDELFTSEVRPAVRLDFKQDLILRDKLTESTASDQSQDFSLILQKFTASLGL
jgi:hypothetical protein